MSYGSGKGYNLLPKYERIMETVKRAADLGSPMSRSQIFERWDLKKGQWDELVKMGIRDFVSEL